MSEQKITGIDLAKTNFYLFSINAHGKTAAGKIKLSRNQLLNWLAQQPKMIVAMEACGAVVLTSTISCNSVSGLIAARAAGHYEIR
ncbi:transposase [Escherichia coli]